MKVLLTLLSLVPLVYTDDCNIDNTDMWWGDIGNYKANSFLECKAACRVNSACQVWSRSGTVLVEKRKLRFPRLQLRLYSRQEALYHSGGTLSGGAVQDFRHNMRDLQEKPVQPGWC